MTVSADVLPDGSVTVTDNGVTHPPLSPEAVQAIAAQATASANAQNTHDVARAAALLAGLITSAAPAAGANAYAQVTITPGQVVAVLDASSFALVTDSMPGRSDGAGNWVSGPVTVSPQTAPAPPTPTPAPTP
jgi:cytoskeletal protein RodZ